MQTSVGALIIVRPAQLQETMMRYLYRVDDDELVACASNRRDFARVNDGTLWAHESHDWLVAAGSGVPLAHRTRGIYYSADTGAPLYYETSEPIATKADATASVQQPPRPRADPAEAPDAASSNPAPRDPLSATAPTSTTVPPQGNLPIDQLDRGVMR